MVVVRLATRRRYTGSRDDASVASATQTSDESARGEPLHPHANGRGSIRRTGLSGRELRERSPATNERKLDVRYDFRWPGRRVPRARRREVTSSLRRQQRGRISAEGHASYAPQQKVN